MRCRARRVLFGALLLCGAVACRGSLEGYREHLLREPPTGSGPAVTATWLGTAGVLLSDGATRILIDPFVSRYGMVHVGLGRDMTPDDAAVADWIDRVGAQGTALVLVSHSHYDHAMDAPLFARRLGARLVGSASTANVARGLGLAEDRIVTVTAPTPISAGEFRVRFLVSEHGRALFGRIPYPGTIDAPLQPPAPADAWKLGGAYSIVVEHPLGTILHHASAGWVEGMFAGVRADVVMLGVAGRDDSEAYLRAVVDAVGARRLVPFHFDDFFAPIGAPLRPLAGIRLDEFFASVAAHEPTVRPETLPIGEPRVIFAAR